MLFYCSAELILKEEIHYNDLVNSVDIAEKGNNSTAETCTGTKFSMNIFAVLFLLHIIMVEIFFSNCIFYLMKILLSDLFFVQLDIVKKRIFHCWGGLSYYPSWQKCFLE